MSKVISTLALTIFAGASVAAGLPATKAEAHSIKRSHCVKVGNWTNATNCPDRVRRRYFRPPTIVERDPPPAVLLRRFDSDIQDEKVGGGAGGDGGGGDGGNR